MAKVEREKRIYGVERNIVVTSFLEGHHSTTTSHLVDLIEEGLSSSPRHI